MSLELWTSRIWLPDADLLNVTRGTGGVAGAPFAPSRTLLSRAKRGELCFGEYEPLYIQEMRASYRSNRAAWDELLARPRAVIGCYEVDPEECHRNVLAAILVKLGATYRGEIPLPPPRRKRGAA